MRAFIIRTTTFLAEGKRIVQDYAVLSDCVENAMVCVIRDQPVGVMIERTSLMVSLAEAQTLALLAHTPKLIPEPTEPCRMNFDDKRMLSNLLQ